MVSTLFRRIPMDTSKITNINKTNLTKYINTVMKKIIDSGFLPIDKFFTTVMTFMIFNFLVSDFDMSIQIY